MDQPRALVSLACTLFLALLLGCSTTFSPGPEIPVQTAFGPIGGVVHGGQQPLNAAHIYAYETSTTSYGGASKSLITASNPVSGFTPVSDGVNDYVLTNKNGQFEISASTACDSNTVVYLYSVDGDPGTGPNSAAGLLAVLGTCPASGKLVNAITAGTQAFVSINELSTVAAAYTLAGFAASATAIGNTGTALGNTGIQNAAANANQIYATVTAASTVAGPPVAARTATPNGNGVVPQALVHTLANILAACINSTGPSSSACSTIFSDVRSGGGQAGTAPTDTATAAIYLAQHPYSAYVSTLYNLVGSTAVPFTPALSAAPNDFAVSLVFTASLNGPYQIAFDASGNAWITNSGGPSQTGAASVAKLSPLGVPATGSPFTPTTFTYPLGIVVDQNANVWIGNSAAGNVVELTSAGALSHTYTTDISDPVGLAIDASNNVWVATTSGDAVTKISNTAGTATFTTLADTKAPYFVAITPGGNPWVTEDSTGITEYTSSDTSVGYFDTAGLCSGLCRGIAVDSSGYIWTADASANVVDKINSSGTSAASTSVPITPEFLAIDGANNVWASTGVASSGTAAAGNQVYGIVELSSSDAVVGPPAGVGYTAGGKLQLQRGISVDGSGDVWVANYDYYNTSNALVAGNTVVEFLGLATPVVTPLNPSQLSTRP